LAAVGDGGELEAGEDAARIYRCRYEDILEEESGMGGETGCKGEGSAAAAVNSKVRWAPRKRAPDVAAGMGSLNSFKFYS